MNHQAWSHSEWYARNSPFLNTAVGCMRSLVNAQERSLNSWHQHWLHSGLVDNDLKLFRCLYPLEFKGISMVGGYDAYPINVPRTD